MLHDLHGLASTKLYTLASTNASSKDCKLQGV